MVYFVELPCHNWSPRPPTTAHIWKGLTIAVKKMMVCLPLTDNIWCVCSRVIRRISMKLIDMNIVWASTPKSRSVITIYNSMITLGGAKQNFYISNRSRSKIHKNVMRKPPLKAHAFENWWLLGAKSEINMRNMNWIQNTV